jgi:LysR family transcriptional regulator, hydrogen peroxide-inducible genes activator
MNLNELRYVVALARERHFGKAATSCHVTQPTLSVAVKKLEDELGIQLFERHRHDVRITPVGAAVITQAQRVLEEADKLRQLADPSVQQFGTPLRIGAIFTIGPYLFPALVTAARRMAPQLSLSIEENFTHVLAQRLRDGEVDAILIALPFSEPGVVVTPLYDETFEVLLPANHPLAKQKRIAPDALDDEPVLMLGEGHCLRDQVLSFCSHINGDSRSSRTEVSASSLETIRHMVAAGMGISVLPQTACASPWYDDGVLVTRPFVAPEPLRRVALAWRSSFPRTQAIDVLIAATREAAKKRGTRAIAAAANVGVGDQA